MEIAGKVAAFTLGAWTIALQQLSWNLPAALKCQEYWIAWSI